MRLQCFIRLQSELTSIQLLIQRARSALRISICQTLNPMLVNLTFMLLQYKF